mmetsp:Transcript_44735/g.62176  ORF Transcript_44735/g.62176 Transcript_44735/m.62176 type:complete len:88 (+) Transcript_44735:18-281(+)
MHPERFEAARKDRTGFQPVEEVSHGFWPRGTRWQSPRSKEEDTTSTEEQAIAAPHATGGKEMPNASPHPAARGSPRRLKPNAQTKLR